MIKLPDTFHGAHLEKTDQEGTELSYSYLGRARIILTRDSARTWTVEASFDEIGDKSAYPAMKVLRTPPIPESQVLKALETGYQWLHDSLEDDANLAEQVLQESLDSDREANSRLEEFKKGHPPTLWERLG